MKTLWTFLSVLLFVSLICSLISEELQKTSKKVDNRTTGEELDRSHNSYPAEGFGDFHFPRPLENDRLDFDNRSDNFDTGSVDWNSNDDRSDGKNETPNESLDHNLHLSVDEEEGCRCVQTLPQPQPQPPEVNCQCFGESITTMPSNLTLGLTRLSLISLGIEILESNAFQNYRNLTDLYMESMKKLHLIESGVFLHLDQLRTVYIKFAPLLKHIPEGVFMGTFKKLRILRIVQTGLEVMPALNYLETYAIISMIDFDSNRIRNLTSHSIKVKAEIMNIDYNAIECVHNWAFHGSEIAKLSLKGNKNLVHLQEKAFEGLRYLRELDLSETSITKLPTLGIDTLETLKVQNTFTLKEIPSVMNFKNIRTAFLTYPYHCCAFKFPATHNPQEFAKYQLMFKEDVEKRYCDLSPTPNPGLDTNPVTDDNLYLMSIYHKTKDKAQDFANKILNLFANQDLNPINENHIKLRHLNQFGQVLSTGTRSPDESNTVYGKVVFNVFDNNQTESVDRVIKEMGLQQDGPTFATKTTTPKPVIGFGEVDTEIRPQTNTNPENQPPGAFGIPVTSLKPKQEFCGDIFTHYPNIKCFPIPDAFNPCEDVMGNGFLRILVWVVVIAAVLGNCAVMIVLMSGRFTFNVSKFLMINLAVADLMMGVYLLIIAVVDLRTVGQYFNYAIDWQHGMGCKIAGFITVFASELSIFTLTVITLERWFAITFAIQLNKRLKLGLAVKVMIGGWAYALLMASLPLMGISTYSKTSICLPMENKEVADVAYLIALLTINGLAFVLISACYAKMYCSIISQQTRATVNDMTIAKRMALLVFTDFVCWAPIAFFGLTAIAGFPLIDVPKSKFLLVTFYPLNSCANPFLYAILTKQYRRDFFILVSRYGFCTKRALKYKNASSHGHLRVAAIRSHTCGHAARTGSLLSQVSYEHKHNYKYICRAHHHKCQSDERSAVFSTVDIYPELSSRSNSRSNDSMHEIVRIGHKNGLMNNEITHKKRKGKDKRRKYSLEFMSSEDESTSSALHKCSPYPQRKNETKRLPSVEQKEILQSVLQKDKNKSCLTCALSHTSACRLNKMCSTCVGDSSSGEKSGHEYDTQLLRWTKVSSSKCTACAASVPKTSSGSLCGAGNASFVMSSHSNSANEDTEI